MIKQLPYQKKTHDEAFIFSKLYEEGRSVIGINLEWWLDRRIIIYMKYTMSLSYFNAYYQSKFSLQKEVFRKILSADQLIMR